MKILILGSGLMGPAAAYNAVQDSDVSQVTLCDINQQRLDAAQAKLEGLKGADKLATAALDEVIEIFRSAQVIDSLQVLFH